MSGGVTRLLRTARNRDLAGPSRTPHPSPACTKPAGLGSSWDAVLATHTTSGHIGVHVHDREARPRGATAGVWDAWRSAPESGGNDA